MEVLEVSSKSSPSSIAGAIASAIHENGAIKVRAVGAEASNQAIKTIAIARGYLAPSGVDIIYIPAFASISIDGDERTIIKLIVEPQ